jgi:hypothetical protein
LPVFSAEPVGPNKFADNSETKTKMGTISARRKVSDGIEFNIELRLNVPAALAASTLVLSPTC